MHIIMLNQLDLYRYTGRLMYISANNTGECITRDVIGAPKSALGTFLLRMVKNIFWKMIMLCYGLVSNT